MADTQAFPTEGMAPPDFGEPARAFVAATTTVERYHLDAVAGRWLVLMFFGSLGNEASIAALGEALNRRDLFNERDAAFFGVSIDPADRGERGIACSPPGVRFFWDFDAAASRLYGLVGDGMLSPAVFLIDPTFRIVMAEDLAGIGQVMDRLERELAATPEPAGEPFAPVLVLPRILETGLCADLIACFEHGTPTPSGFSVDAGGRTVQRLNPDLKRRSDVMIEDEGLINALRTRLETRLFPMVKRAFGWQARHIERYLICRYDAADQGFFFPHRDDVTLGTAHRKFAVTLNLNAEDYDGGELRFPEFGRRTYRAPTGGACVFGCNLLHEATPVTRGTRYAVVPFLYDEDGAKLRAANLAHVD